MRDPVRLDLNYVAKTYGLDGIVTFRLEDTDTDRTILVMTELSSDLADELAFIRSIGEDLE